jgi:hypothetical protein
MAATVLIGKARQHPERAEHRRRRKDWNFATLILHATSRSFLLKINITTHNWEFVFRSCMKIPYLKYGFRRNRLYRAHGIFFPFSETNNHISTKTNQFIFQGNAVEINCV